MSVTINDVLLEHSCAHLVVYCLWLLLYCNIRSEKLLQRLKYLLSGPLQQNVCWHLLQRVSALNHVPHSLFSLSLIFLLPYIPFTIRKEKEGGSCRLHSKWEGVELDNAWFLLLLLLLLKQKILVIWKFHFLIQALSLDRHCVHQIHIHPSHGRAR